MKIVVPMAGMGTRMRPHTLVTPKPLLPIAGKAIVQRLVEDIAQVCDQQIEEIAFIIHPRFGEAVEEQLKSVASDLGATGSIHYQREAQGTAHAILCAEPALSGPVVVAFADTLFIADFKLDADKDGIIWTKKVDDPSAFGVVKTNATGHVEEFLEKPETFVSDQAIIGIYYFKDGENLKNELQFLIDNDIRIKGGEFGLTDALENMKNKGIEFSIDTVDHWLDCGNKDATVLSNKQVLEHSDEDLISDDVEAVNSLIIPPCYVAPGVKLENSIIGPHVSIGESSSVVDSVVSNSIIRDSSHIENAVLENSMIGQHAKVSGGQGDLSLGDYSSIKL